MAYDRVSDGDNFSYKNSSLERPMPLMLHSLRKKEKRKSTRKG